MDDLDEGFLEDIAEWMKALADPTRLRILQLLKGGEKCVNGLLGCVGCSQANVSKHLAVLKRAGLVEARREGASVFYRIADPSVFVICETVCDSLERRISARHAGIERRRDAFRPAGSV